MVNATLPSQRKERELPLQALYDRLRERLPRLTKGKKLVAHCLLENNQPLTAHDIHSYILNTHVGADAGVHSGVNSNAPTDGNEASDESSSAVLDLATVYRNLEQLERVGVIEKIAYSSAGWQYVLAGTGHTHSIRCVRCEQEVVMNQCMLAEVERLIAQQTGFETIRHTVNFTGTCPACQPPKHT